MYSKNNNSAWLYYILFLQNSVILSLAVYVVNFDPQSIMAVFNLCTYYIANKTLKHTKV